MKFSKCALLASAFIAMGSLLAKETVSYDLKAKWQGDRKLSQGEGGVALKGNSFILSKPFAVDPAKKYTVRYTVSVKDLPADQKLSVNVGFFVYDANNRVIFCSNICAVPNTFAKTLAAAKKGDKTILVDKSSKAAVGSWNNLAINAKADLSDLPNRNLVADNVKSIVQKGNGWEITFGSPLRKDIPAGTFIRLQSTGGYLQTGGSVKNVTAAPQTASGTITGIAPKGRWTKAQWPVGTAKAAVYIQTVTKAKDFQLQFKDFAIDIE